MFAPVKDKKKNHQTPHSRAQSEASIAGIPKYCTLFNNSTFYLSISALWVFLKR